MKDLDLWFAMAELSNKIKIHLIKEFKDIDKLWYYSINKRNNSLISEKIIKKLVESWNKERIECLKGKIEHEEMSIVTYNDNLYPEKLKNYDDAPFLLFYKGNIKRLNETYNISMVGSRVCTSYGQNIAKIISEDLSTNNINIISGLARGIDTIAHVNSVESGGFTCAVLGCGLDIAYPPENKGLYKKIYNSGCIISQFLPQTKPLAYNFPIRNRIISALSDLVIVIEASAKSGSLITASAALEQGLDVMAVPGSVFSKQSKGTNKLIKDGAFVFTEMSDIYDILGIKIKQKKNYKKAEIKQGNYKIIYDKLSDDPIHIDDIISTTHIDIQQIYAVLFEMQLKDEVICLSGNYYVKANSAI
ncbi:MAG: DNA-processing protein DprA [Bacillota bacterium]|nr:DNA-processing protein DprA [Bacillota bacterium]